jgi:hypothetical protein
MLMVSHLHQLGFQKIRLCPGIAPNGSGWRGLVTAKSNTLELHGARTATWSDDLVAKYGSGQGNEYFGWTDCTNATAEQLATTFLERLGVTGRTVSISEQQAPVVDAGMEVRTGRNAATRLNGIE